MPVHMLDTLQLICAKNVRRKTNQNRKRPVVSLAGVRSSRGDSYELLIALDWVIKMLGDQSILQVDVESTDLDPSGMPIQVDDVVIWRNAKPTVYCQCKKNQPDFKPWTVSNLVDDLKKAALQLLRDPNGIVYFYSTTEFGSLAKLKEHANAYPDEASYRESLTRIKGLSEANNKLDKCWADCISGAGLKTFDVLQRVTFESTKSQALLRNELINQLGMHVTRKEVVYDTLLGHFAQVKSRTTEREGAAVSIPGLTRDRTLRLLQEAGAVHTPPRIEADLLHEFRNVSAVGREWRRDIGAVRIPRQALGEALDHIRGESKRVLITGAPGLGKTCLLLDLLDNIEADPTRALLFIQGRVYGVARSAAERDEFGLPGCIRNSVARMAEHRPVVVILDSLDVLSLAREHGVLDFFLSLIDQLSLIPRVTVVAACRTFDLKYDSRLANRDWGKTVTLGLLDWQQEVVPLLRQWKVDPSTLPDALGQLLRNPRMLAIFEEITHRAPVPIASTSQELSERYLETVVLTNPALGDTAMAHLERLARQMLKNRRVSISELQANLPDDLKNALLSTGILVSSDRAVSLGHQTLLDVLAVREALRSGETLLDFITNQPATPFVRPTVRSFFFYLRATDQPEFRRQIRVVLESEHVPFHLKRLISESLAEIDPNDDDWRLIQLLFKNNHDLFPSFFFATQSPAWYQFIQKHWWPLVCESRDSAWALHYARHMRAWLATIPNRIVTSWIELLELEWVHPERVAAHIKHALYDLSEWDLPGARSLLQRLMTFPVESHDLLGRILAKWIEATDGGDDLLWEYIAGDISSEDAVAFHLGGKLRCAAHDLGSDIGFLARRMQCSEYLLDSAIAALERWSQLKSSHMGLRKGFYNGFLRDTSYGERHSKEEVRFTDAEEILLRAIESACLEHAKNDTLWWQNHESKLRQSSEGALRYIAILAYAENPTANVVGIAVVLQDKAMLEYSWRFELGELIRAAFHLLDKNIQDGVTSQILKLYTDDLRSNEAEPPWIIEARRDLLAAIPSYLRSQRAIASLDDACQRYGPPERDPHIEIRGGVIRAPFSYARFIESADEGVVRILLHYSADSVSSHEYDFLIGGRTEVGLQLAQAASRQPKRFMALLSRYWNNLDNDFRLSILSGVTNYLRYRFGNLSSGNQWEPLETPPGPELAEKLLSELNTHTVFWRHKREAAQTLEACAWVVHSEPVAAILMFHLIGFVDATDPDLDRADGVGLVDVGINSSRGNAATAAITLTNRWIKADRSLPALLVPTLLRFSSDPHPGVRAVLLRHLCVLQHWNPELGWLAFDRATANGDAEIWSTAEPCLYHAYHNNFDTIEPYLARMCRVGAYEPWARISALACLSGHIPTGDLRDKLGGITESAAWKGASQVFACNAGHKQHHDRCLSMLSWCLEHAPEPNVVADEIGHHLFDCSPPVSDLSAEFLELFFSVRKREAPESSSTHHYVLKWISSRVSNCPDDALETMEIMLAIDQHSSTGYLDQTAITVLNSLLREAEEREPSDGGSFLTRVIALQDKLLKNDVHGVDQWLKDSERP